MPNPFPLGVDSANPLVHNVFVQDQSDADTPPPNTAFWVDNNNNKMITSTGDYLVFSS